MGQAALPGLRRCQELFRLGESGRRLRNLLKRVREEGQDLVEYGLRLALVAMAAIVSMKTLANRISNVFSRAAMNLTSTS